jgi:hypothetical protein
MLRHTDWMLAKQVFQMYWVDAQTGEIANRRFRISVDPPAIPMPRRHATQPTKSYSGKQQSPRVVPIEAWSVFS